MRLVSRISKLQIKLKALSPVIDDESIWCICGDCAKCEKDIQVMALYRTSSPSATNGAITWKEYESMLEERGLKYTDPDGLEW